MDLKHLEQIVAISRHGGFSGAARRLGVAQSTLSKNIARLEAKLGVELFARDGGAAQPTPYGRFLVTRAEAVLREVEALNRDFDKLLHGERGRLRIGVGPAPRHGLLAPIVAAMAQRYPELSIRTAQDNAQRLVSDLAEGVYDAVFVHQEAAAPFGDLVRVRVLQSPHVALARPGHPILRGRPLTPQDLLEFRMAACPPSAGFLDWIGPVQGLQAEHLAGFRTDSYDLIRDQVLTGDFVTVAPAFVFQADVERGVLASAPLAWDGLYECWMLVARERWQAPEMKAMAEAAKAAGARLEAALAP
jgi:DNA-binding transcriptional LysR family regulator